MGDNGVDWSDFQGKTGFDTLQLAGRSFGTTTLFFLVSHGPTEGFVLLPVTHALFLDPWLEQFEKPGPAQAGKNSRVKKVVLRSEGFALWREHMVQMVEVARLGNLKCARIHNRYDLFS